MPKPFRSHDSAIESIDISAAPEKVWDLLIRFATIPTWYAGCDSVRVTSAPADSLGVGLADDVLSITPGDRESALRRNADARSTDHTSLTYPLDQSLAARLAP